MSFITKSMMRSIVQSIGTGWDISNLQWNGGGERFNLSLVNEITNEIFFGDNGTKLYTISNTVVIQYSLSTAWDVSTASFVQTFNFSTEESTATGIFFKPDGAKMYIVGIAGDDVNEYNLSTAWDVSTASFVQNFSIAGQETAPSGIHFKPDGAKMYIVGSTGDDVNEYNLSTAWDVSTASFVQNFSIAGQETTPAGIFFKPDGTKMYVSGQAGDDVNEYNLSTAWDVSTASFVQTYSLPSSINPTSLFFSSDGTKMYSADSFNDLLLTYSLSTAWDVSTASLIIPSSGYFDITSQETSPTSIFFKSDGTKMYVCGFTSDNVNEYDLSTAWNITSASFVQSFSVVTQDSLPFDLFFSSDGTKMYILGRTNTSVYEYGLSSAWDVSTASFSQAFNVSTQETTPQGFYFKPDGTKMYVTGLFNSEVFEYDLSTPWNISTASVLQSFDYSSLFTGPVSIAFKTDGTKMYILSDNNNSLNEFDLSTAWDVTSATFNQSKIFAILEKGPDGAYFKPDGKKIYTTIAIANYVLEYDL